MERWRSCGDKRRSGQRKTGRYYFLTPGLVHESGNIGADTRGAVETPAMMGEEVRGSRYKDSSDLLV